MEFINKDTQAIFGQIQSLRHVNDGKRDIWAYEIDEQRVFVASSALAKRIGRTLNEVGEEPVILDVIATDDILVATDGCHPARDFRNTLVTDMSEKSFVYNLGLADAYDGTMAAYCCLVESEIPRGKLYQKAETHFRRWLEMVRGAYDDWATEMIVALRHIRNAAEDGIKGDHDGAHRTKQICNTTMNLFRAAENSKSDSGRQILLGSRITGQLHDFDASFKFKSSLLVAKSALVAMNRNLEKTYDFEKKIVKEAIERAEATGNPVQRRQELSLAMTWAWYAIYRRQHLKKFRRHEGKLGVVLENLETAVQWSEGSIPDRGSFRDIDIGAKNTPERDLALANAFQNTRKSFAQRDEDEKGERVWTCREGEKIVSGSELGTRVVGADGTILFHMNSARSPVRKLGGVLNAFAARKRDKEEDAPAVAAKL